MRNSENMDMTKFEFLLSMGNNIICQRYFMVRSHIPQSLKSVDLYEVIKEISDDIQGTLKLKTTDVLEIFHREDMSKLPTESSYFTISLKKENEIIMQRIFPSNLYPPKVRYSVDIRPQISYFLHRLTDVLSRKKLETIYLDQVI